jgi:hypothetical protein
VTSYKINLLIFSSEKITIKISSIKLLYSITFNYENIYLKVHYFHSLIYFGIYNDNKMMYFNVFLNSQQKEDLVLCT